MKSNELRVGNYIQNDSGVKCLASIHCDNTIRTFNEEKSDTIGCFFLSSFEPIELTEEWLLQLGFSSNDYRAGYIGKDFTSGQMTLSFVLCNPFAKGDWNDCYTFDLRDSMFKSLRYVHELQNLYFSLTSEELTIATNGC